MSLKWESVLDKATPLSTSLFREALTRSKARTPSFTGMMKVSMVMLIPPFELHNHDRVQKVLESNGKVLDDAMLFLKSCRRPRIWGELLEIVFSDGR